MKYPKIEHEGKTLYQIGCKKCKTAQWKIYSDRNIFIAECNKCGHKLEIGKIPLQRKPDS